MKLHHFIVFETFALYIAISYCKIITSLSEKWMFQSSPTLLIRSIGRISMQKENFKTKPLYPKKNNNACQIYDRKISKMFYSYRQFHYVFSLWLTDSHAMVPEGHIVLMYSIYSVFCWFLSRNKSFGELCLIAIVAKKRLRYYHP